jgi:HlyD family secretion protein
MERIVVATGTIEPEEEVEVRPRISGIIDKIYVEAGDRVEQGQPLLEIDRELLEVRAREARAKLDAARAEARYARTLHKRATALREQAAAAERELDAATNRLESAIAMVAQGKAAVESLEVQLRYATVLSPLAGKVLDVFVEEGSAVSAVTAVTGGTPLVSLAAADALHLEGLIDENEVSRVKVGQPARIRTEAFEDRVFEGQVRKIAPLGERKQNVTYFEVEIEITDSDSALLRPRMSGDGEIVTEILEEVLVVPETALLYDGSQIYVEVQADSGDPSRFERKDIKIGAVEGDRVQVLEGLEGGEEVLLH